jgi:hypothetical protein
MAAVPLRRLVLGSHREIAGTVYGTTVVMATVVAGSRDSAADPWGLAVITGATVVVLWLAHVYSGALADSINRSQPLNRRQLGAIAGQEISIPLAAVAPVGALALAGADVVQLRTAVWVALGIGVATLVIQGLRYARIERLGRLGTATAVCLNLALGLFIVALNALLVH